MFRIPQLLSHFFCALLLSIFLTSQVHASLYGDITSQLQHVGNPTQEYGYNEGNRTYQHIYAFQNRLYLAYGDSSNTQAKRTLYIDLADHSIGFDNPGDLFNEEQFSHFREFDGELYLHSYDAFSRPRFYRLRSSGWEKKQVNHGSDHMRDTYKIGDKVFVSFRQTGRKFPAILEANFGDPIGNFSIVNQTAPSGFSDVDDFLGEKFFEYDGKLFTTYFLRHFVIGTYTQFNSWGKVPYMIYYDPANPSAKWQVAHANPGTFFSSSDISNNGASNNRKGSKKITEWASVTNSQGEHLVFGGWTRRTNDATEGQEALFVADGILSGTRTHVPLTGVSTTTANEVFVIKRDNALYAITIQRPASAAGSLATVWVHRCTDFESLTDTNAWVELFSYRKIGAFSSVPIFSSPVEVANGNFYITESTERFDGNGSTNKTYNGSGSIWRFSPDNQLPEVTLTAPSASNGISDRSSFLLTADASDSDGSVTKVEFFYDDTKIGEDTTAPYSFNWTAVPIGTFRITARATDDDNEVRTSRPFQVTLTNQAPSISIDSPASQSLLPLGSTVTIQTTVSDTDSPEINGSRIERVEFFENGNLIDQTTTAPHSLSWTPATKGSYQLTAVAFDTDGESNTSSGVSLYVYGEASIPFSDNFDDTTGPVTAGSRLWYQDVGMALEIEATVGVSDSHAVALQRNGLGSLVLNHNFSDSGVPLNWTEFSLKPVAFDVGAQPDINADSSVAFYFNSDGHLEIRNGANWEILSSVTPINFAEFQRLSVFQDYRKQTWDLWLNGESVAKDIAFANSVSHFSKFSVAHGEDVVGYLDDVAVQTIVPSGLSGAQSYELWKNSIPWVNPTLDSLPEQNPDFDRFNNFQEYVFGQNPLIANSPVIDSYLLHESNVDYIAMSYPENKQAYDVRMQLQTSIDLSTWDSTDIFEQGFKILQDNGMTRTLELKKALTVNSDPLFMRLRATRVE